MASEAGPASSGAGEVPSHGQVGLQGASQVEEVSMLLGVLQDASQEAGASRSQEVAAFLLAGSLSLEGQEVIKRKSTYLQQSCFTR